MPSDAVFVGNNENNWKVYLGMGFINTVMLVKCIPLISGFIYRYLSQKNRFKTKNFRDYTISRKCVTVERAMYIISTLKQVVIMFLFFK